MLAVSADREVPFLLINPPFTDPTQPYHSLSYLMGAAFAAGYCNGTCIDTNVEALNYLSTSNAVEDILEEAAEIRCEMQAKPRLTRRDHLRYCISLKALGLHRTSVTEALEVFTDSHAFFHYPTYRQAVYAVKRWAELLSLRGLPGSLAEFVFSPATLINMSSSVDLCRSDLVELTCRPFDPYWNGPFLRELKSKPWQLIGLSVNYVHQLVFSIYLVAFVRRICPNAVIVLGGTEISDILKYSKDASTIWKLFPTADAVVAGEGESALVRLLSAVESGRRIVACGPGILARTERGISICDAKPVYERIDLAAGPRYDIWPLKHYWSPKPVLLYSPTRGCYWNRCTFCDYGLNSEGPTSPSRERVLSEVEKDLGRIAGLTDTMYLAVDAISPKYLKRLAELMIGASLNLNWSAEVRLDHTLIRELPKVLRRAGCVALSFGYESGSQRILDLIDKGIKIVALPDILKSVADAKIAVQMMGFVGFPSERADEMAATYKVLITLGAFWTLAGIGSFSLTGGSIVAKQPGRFGIKEARAHCCEDISRSLLWRMSGDASRVPPSEEFLLESLAPVIRRFEFDRPFLGGIDTAHSLLYFSEFGPDLIPKDQIREEPRVRLVEAVACESLVGSATEMTAVSEIEKEFQRRRFAGEPNTSADFQYWWDGETVTTHSAPAEMPVVVLEDGAVLGQRLISEIENGSDQLKTVCSWLLKHRGIEIDFATRTA